MFVVCSFGKFLRRWSTVLSWMPELDKYWHKPILFHWRDAQQVIVLIFPVDHLHLAFRICRPTPSPRRSQTFLSDRPLRSLSILLEMMTCSVACRFSYRVALWCHPDQNVRQPPNCHTATDRQPPLGSRESEFSSWCVLRGLSNRWSRWRANHSHRTGMSSDHGHRPYWMERTLRAEDRNWPVLDLVAYWPVLSLDRQQCRCLRMPSEHLAHSSCEPQLIGQPLSEDKDDHR